jgi:hypothetical protein
LNLNQQHHLSPFEEINSLHTSLALHPVYRDLNNLKNLRTFMGHHVFAVWDFMSLLKSLQRKITCVDVPWKPSKYDSTYVHLINQIVVCEESDIGPDGSYWSHFELYLKAMTEIGADTRPILNFLNTQNYTHLPSEISNFVSFNLDVAKNGQDHQVAAVFFFGREKLIPQIFTPILDSLEKTTNSSTNSLKYYLKRHIEVDGGDHSIKAEKLLIHLCENDPIKIKEAASISIKALKLRTILWDEVLLKIQITQ